MDAPRPTECPDPLPTPEELALLQKAVPPNCKLIFASLAGSSCYNLRLPDSDRDLIGVYCYLPDFPLRPSGPSTITQHNPDFTLHEVGKFLEVLAKGSPNLVEALWIPKAWFTEEWSIVLKARSASLNKYSVFIYARFADGFWKKYVPGEHKKLYQAYRCLKEAESILEGQPPRVSWQGPERDYIVEIRSGKHQDKPLEEIKTLRQKVDDAMKTTTLPKKVPKELVGAIHTEIKMTFLRSVIPSDSSRILTPRDEAQASLTAPAREILDKNKIEGHLLFCGPVGFGEEQSYLAIYSAHPSHIYSVYYPLPPVLSCGDERQNFGDDTWVNKIGYQVMELSSFFDELLSGNYLLLRSLFLPSDCFWSCLIFYDFIQTLKNDFGFGKLFYTTKQKLDCLKCITNLLNPQDTALQHKGELFEFCKSRKETPGYHVDREGPPHAPRFKATVKIGEQSFTHGTTMKTKSQAEQEAALVALIELDKFNKRQLVVRKERIEPLRWAGLLLHEAENLARGKFPPSEVPTVEPTRNQQAILARCKELQVEFDQPDVQPEGLLLLAEKLVLEIRASFNNFELK